MPAKSSIRTVTALALAAVAVPAVAAAGNTSLASRTPNGRFPNGPSFNASFSQDRKAASLLAYDSTASDIVGGDSNGLSDVFVVRRAKPFEVNPRKAKAWKPGSTSLVSVGMGGAPADGASFLPDLDGDQMHGAHCVAFLSDATNLVPGDTNGKTDAFVRDLRNGRTTRVSVNSRGEQADGASYDVQVDGACDRVAFTSDATNLAFTRDQVPKPRTIDSPLTGAQRRRCRAKTPHKPCKTRKLRVKNERASLVTGTPPAGTKQVYVRVIGNEPDDAHLTGATFLASASGRGVPGNGDSFDAAFGNLGAGCPDACGTTSGDAVAFTSSAANLTGGDGNGVTDVYGRSFRLPVQHFTERRAKLPRYVDTRTVLVSATRGGSAGNGASDQPAVDGTGRFVSFRTASRNLAGNDTNGVTDVLAADLDKRRVVAVSKNSRKGVQANGASSSPTMARSGRPVLFQTDASNLTVVPAPDRNCTTDVLSWRDVKLRLSIESRDSAGVVSGNSNSACSSPQTAPAVAPASSWYGNYGAFEDSNPLLDRAVADRVYPGLRSNPGQAAAMAFSDPSLHQVYVRFVGP